MAVKGRPGLRWTGKQWSIHMRYPKVLAEALGKDFYLAPCRTSDLREAEQIRDSLKRELEKLARDFTKAEQLSVQETELKLIQDVRNKLSAHNEALEEYGYLNEDELMELPAVRAYKETQEAISEHAQRMDAEEQGTGYHWKHKVQGDRTPIMLYLDKWCLEKKCAPSTEQSRRSEVERLTKWTTKPIEALKRKDASDYIAYLISEGLSSNTINQYRSKLSAYWSFMLTRGLVEGTINIWEDQGVNLGDTERKLAWSPKEIRTLISKAPNAQLRDAILLGAHSGLRVAEITGLTVETTKNNRLVIKEAKSKTGIRSVPIHSAVQDVVAKRRENKDPSELLFPEFHGTPNRLTQGFSRYRKTLFEEVSVKNKQASKTFHSLRHFAKTQMLARGARSEIVDHLIGHKFPGMSGVYLHGTDWNERIAAIELINVEDDSLEL